MNRILRRTVGFAATLTVGAALTVAVPAMASADPVLSAPVDVDGFTFDNGVNGSYDLEVLTPPAASLDSSVVLVGYKAILYTNVPPSTTYATVVTTTTTDSANNEEFDFDGLTYGTSYLGAVEAVYLVGGTTTDSAPTEADSGPSVAMQDPDPVSNVRGTAVASGKIKVSWTKPTLGPNQELDGFEILAYDETSTDTQEIVVDALASSNATSYTLHGLTNGRTYDIEVLDSGSLEDQLFPEDVEVTAIGTPNAPSHLKAALHSGGKAKLTWKAATATKAAPITGYHVYVGGKLVKTLGKSTHSYTVAHEHKGKTYTYVVKTYNKIGSSKAATLKKKRTIS